MGAIRYELTRESSPEAIYSKYWREVALMSGGEGALNEKQLSTTLLITPNFGLRNREFFEVRTLSLSPRVISINIIIMIIISLV
jgi:hypothetical protein